MRFVNKHPRLFSTAWYCGAMVSFLTLIYHDDWFCARDGRAILPALFKICLLIFVVDQCASFLSRVVWRHLLKRATAGLLGILIATAIVALILIPLPFVILGGYYRIPFEGTPLDYSCFVTEGYGMMFRAGIAPILVLMTLFRETYLNVLLKRSAA